MLEYRVDGELNSQVIIKVKEIVLWDFLFANDCALNNNLKPVMQVSVNKLFIACDNFGLHQYSKGEIIVLNTEPKFTIKRQ